MKAISVILAGGLGERLGALCTPQRPKPFVTLYGAHSMLQHTWLRLRGAGLGVPLVVCHAQHVALVREQVQSAQILAEPHRRNTAPAIVSAALWARARGVDAIAVFTADHYIADEQIFHRALAQAHERVAQGYYVAFGVVATQAHTGLGYLQCSQAIGGVCEVIRFSEKPSREQAETYLAQGGYYWNSGMFVFPVARLLADMQTLQPDMLRVCEAAFEVAFAGVVHGDDALLLGDGYGDQPAISIDYALMEQASRVAMVPLETEWCDLGTPQAVAALNARLAKTGSVAAG